MSPKQIFTDPPRPRQPRPHLPQTAAAAPRTQPPPTTLWNPVSLIDTSSDSRRSHEPSGAVHYDLGRLAPGPPSSVKHEDGARRRDGGAMDKYPPLRGPPGLPEPSTFLAELEKSTQSFFSQQRASLSLSSQYSDVGGAGKGGPAHVAGMKVFTPGHQGPSRHSQGPSAVVLPGVPGLGLGLSASGSLTSAGAGPETPLVFDEFLQQHRRAVSKLDLEERRRKEAREKGRRSSTRTHARTQRHTHTLMHRVITKQSSCIMSEY